MSKEENFEIQHFRFQFEGLKWCLASLASTRYQVSYIVNGTSQEYVLIQDLINDLDSYLFYFRFDKFPERRPKLVKSCGESAMRHIESVESLLFDKSLYARSEEGDRNFTETDPQWLKMRGEALRALQELDFNLADWEAENV